jgi:broad specificity phosphatase PhoE
MGYRLAPERRATGNPGIAATVGPPMSRRLLLVRHGRPVHVQRERWLSHAGVQRWRRSYDRAHVRADDAPPASLLWASDSAAHIVSSDLPRAVTSAERLGRGGPIATSPLLRETPLHIPAFHSVRLPLSAWETMIHLSWMLRIVSRRGATAAEIERAAAAAEWLTALVGDRSPVVAVTHGAFRHLLATRLHALGWRSQSRLRGFSYWSAWSFYLPH